MSKHEKLLKRIEELKEISFTEAQNLLKHEGFAERSVGSHHTFYKDNSTSITITKRKSLHKDAVKALKLLIRALTTKRSHDDDE